MFKMGFYCSFWHLKHKLWPKEGSGVKLAIWLPTKKSQELTRFTCLQMVYNIPLKSSQRGLQLFFRPHFDLRYARKVMGLQSRESPNLGNFGTSTWESQDKKPFGCGPVERCRVYYKGEGGGFPQVRAVVSLMCPCCLWLVLTLKVLQLCTNHLVWVLCRPMWMSEACQLFLVPSWSFIMPLYPSKCCELGSVPRLLLGKHLSLSRSWECVTKGPMSVSRPFAIGFATTWVIDVSSTIDVGKKFDVHGKVQLPLEVVMDPCPSH